MWLFYSGSKHHVKYPFEHSFLTFSSNILQQIAKQQEANGRRRLQIRLPTRPSETGRDTLSFSLEQSINIHNGSSGAANSHKVDTFHKWNDENYELQTQSFIPSTVE